MRRRTARNDTATRSRTGSLPRVRAHLAETRAETATPEPAREMLSHRLMSSRDTQISQTHGMGLAHQTVLVFDRHAHVRTTLSSLLTEAGHRVVAVDTLEAARNAMERALPAVALITVGAERDGEPHSALRTLQDAFPNAETSYIALLGTGNGLLSALALASGASDCVAHDVEPFEILARVRNQIRILERMDRLATMIHTDELTGLLNRRGLNAELDKSIARARRSAQQLSLLLIDLDRFKEVNDTLGHACGDLVLKKVARVLSRCARTGDAVGRLGGDEFVMVLPEADRMGAARVAARIEQALGELVVASSAASISASIGVLTHLPSDRDGNRDALLAEADRIMYAKKRDRRAARSSAPTVSLPTDELAFNDLRAAAGGERR